MPINAYVLAADPTWLRISVSAYYPFIQRLVVSYDARGLSWTGNPTEWKQCLEELANIDVDRKIQYLAGDYSAGTLGLLEADTRQRQEALDAAGTDADWVLQLDTDEVLPKPEQLVRLLESAPASVQAVEWPMRVLFRRLRGGHYLEVRARDGSPFYEYPGPVAVRSGARLVNARRAEGMWLRAELPGETGRPQKPRPPADLEVRLTLDRDGEAILHNSWARGPRQVARKVRAWGHYDGARTWKYYLLTWLPSPLTWRALRNLHPLFPGTWPALRRVSSSDVDRATGASMTADYRP